MKGVKRSQKNKGCKRRSKTRKEKQESQERQEVEKEKVDKNDKKKEPRLCLKASHEFDHQDIG